MSKILFAVSGSIAGIKAAAAVSQLVQRGHDVQVVATPSALNFVGSATWEGLTGKPVISEIFAEGHQMDHIHLARWAELLILAPASANAIAHWAGGSAHDLPSALFLAFERSKPVLIAPAMNKEMWAHPAVQKNVATLKAWNVHVLEPDAGALACGEVGPGRLIPPEKIVDEIEAALRPNAHRRRVLITSGATREPLDGVRFITNFSTGQTGASLADAFFEQGFAVTYLHGPGAITPSHTSIPTAPFSDFSSLERQLRAELRQGYDVVIQAAAISDFSVDEIRNQGGKVDRHEKIRSDQELELTLKQNPKLVLNLKEWSQPSPPTVIAFKLTNTQDAKERSLAVDRLLARPEIDAVVWNDLSEIQSDHHNGLIFWKNKKPEKFTTKSELAKGLMHGLST
jgi:phosphopantothenoylcysteine decarboxylase/phosphopantothenate--cysteine ligase